ncbi:Hypothetical protein OINT_2001041 [Brucella intermedia LMG 3301]|uniref:Uncharacterized protein n=1 Tax=Brucella intermedia LMG 3301 TaxID=641118 RepID=C4WN98_9HYPH|nr:Hypothetical protein OINT_2001041 [Brucella intermedia LMG 3301]
MARDQTAFPRQAARRDIEDVHKQRPPLRRLLIAKTFFS